MTSEQAEKTYRDAWNEYRMELDDDRRLSLEKTMDSMQKYIASGPKDPRWIDFKYSLEGYVEYWDNILQLTLANWKDKQNG